MNRINNIMQQTFARQLVEEEEPSSPHIIQHQPQVSQKIAFSASCFYFLFYMIFFNPCILDI